MDFDQKKRLTLNYNIYNNVKCPELMGEPGPHSLGKMPKTTDGRGITAKSSITAVSKNAMNYMMAYPIAGVNTDYPPGKIVPVKVTAADGSSKTEVGQFYAGRDHALGSNFFLPMGKCSDKSIDRQCQGQDRYIYVRNIPTGKIPLLGNISFHGLTGCNMKGITESRGLVPGLLEDISDISPFSIMEAAGGDGNYGSYNCKRMTYPIGKNIYDPMVECTGREENCKDKMWQLESRCTPSWHHMKTSTDGNDPRKYPGSVSLGGAESFANLLHPAATVPPPPRAPGHCRCRAAASAASAAGILSLLLLLLWYRRR